MPQTKPYSVNKLVAISRSIPLVIETTYRFCAAVKRPCNRICPGVYLFLPHHDGTAEEETMRLERGQVWRCIDQKCGAEIQVKEPSAITDGSNPRCSCGNIMKMPYSKPQLRRLEATENVRRLLQQLAVALR
jgi:hypothetical protein